MTRPYQSRRTLWLAMLLVVVAGLIAADVRQAVQGSGTRGTFLPLAAFEGPAQTAPTTVAIARSDDRALPEPVAVSRSLTYAQVEALTRRAVELAGGFSGLIHAGDKVLIKPCIVTPHVVRNTDVRVVKAVARLVHEAAGGDVEVIIGEGSAYPAPSDMEYAQGFSTPEWDELWDEGGYEELPGDPDLADVNLRLSNLNGPREELVLVDVPNGGYTGYRGGQVWVHQDVINADVHITVPALKLHTFTGITVGLKNNIGLYPGAIYGFPKEVGVRQDDYRNLLVHQTDAPRDWVDEEIVDIALVAGIDFSVVDAINCSYHQYRRNAIVAGRDVVAVDHVAARLMGINPDDICHLTLADLAGMGTNDPQQIELVGAPIDASWSPFQKGDHYSLDYGQSNRIWLLRGPFHADGLDDPMDHAFIPDEGTVQPRPTQDGWSEPIYFFDDRIDLGSYCEIGAGQKTVAYAFTYFDAPRDQRAELWVGSDEPMRVYLNGEMVYDCAYTRAYGGRSLVKAKSFVDIRGGENTLMVKALQELRDFDFALNICEPEINSRLDGNRVWGLKFRTSPRGATAVGEGEGESLPGAFALAQNYPNPFNASTVIPYHIRADGPVPVRLSLYSAQGQLVRTLVDRPVSPGRHIRAWDGRDRYGLPVASGVYVCRLEVGVEAQSSKLLLLR